MKQEIDLIDGLKKGKSEAYQFIFDHYYSILCQIAYEFVRDHYLAQTMVSDVIFTIWEKRESIHFEKSIQGYLIKAVKNNCLNYLNANAQKRECIYDFTLRDTLFEAIADSNVDPLDSLTTKELEEKIQHLLSVLPIETQKVFTLSRLYDMPHDEIAKKLNISVNTVKYHIKKALSYFRKNLSDYMYFLVMLLYR